MATSDACTREAAWLSTVGDALPVLVDSGGGPFGVLQAYATRNPATRKRQLYVLRTEMLDRRYAEQRKIVTYDFILRIYWPIGSSTTGDPLWETESANLDTAVDQVLQRVRGLVGDHTHGGRFLSVAETPEPGRIRVRFDDPWRTASVSPATLRAEITYSADDHMIG